MAEIRAPRRVMADFLEKTRGMSNPSLRVCKMLLIKVYPPKKDKQPHNLQCMMLSDKVELPVDKPVESAAKRAKVDQALKEADPEVKPAESTEAMEVSGYEGYGDGEEIDSAMVAAAQAAEKAAQEANVPAVIPDKVVLQSGDSVMGSMFDFNVPEEQVLPIVVDVTLSTNVYNGSVQYRISNLSVLDTRPPYHHEVFSKYIYNTSMARFPIVPNFKHGQRYMNFVLPLGENPYFTVTDVQFEWKNRDTFCHVDSKDSKITRLGLHEIIKFKPVNVFAVDYIRETVSEDGTVSKEKCLMKYSYTPTAFEQFGVVFLNNWKAIAPFLVTCCVNAYVSGYTDKERLLKNTYVRAEQVPDADNAVQHLSVGFITNLYVDMVKTVEKIAYPMNEEYAKSFLKSKTKIDSEQHALNKFADEKLMCDDGFEEDKYVFNMSEMSPFARNEFFTMLEDERCKRKVKYFGVMDYEDTTMAGVKLNEEGVENTMEEKNAKPAVVFAIASKA